MEEDLERAGVMLSSFSDSSKENSNNCTTKCLMDLELYGECIHGVLYCNLCKENFHLLNSTLCPKYLSHQSKLTLHQDRRLMNSRTPYNVDDVNCDLECISGFRVNLFSVCRHGTKL